MANRPLPSSGPEVAAARAWPRGSGGGVYIAAMALRRLGVAVLAAAAVPFFVTGLFRLSAPYWTVFAASAAVGLALVLRPGMARAAATGWLAGCALWAAALVLVLNSLGDGLSWL